MFDASNYFTSGDHLYNNSFEVADISLMMSINGSEASILNYNPIGQNGTSGNFEVSYGFADQSLSLSWSNGTGGNMDIETRTGYQVDERYCNWTVFPALPRLWLPEVFKAQFGTEFRLEESVNSITVNHKMSVMTEQFLINRDEYRYIDSIEY